jgi:predicted metal-dependent phosphoesterase TrpH
MNKVDLHVHTTHSDGSKTPKEIIDLAKEVGIYIMAITDHDNIEGSKEVVKNHPSNMIIYSGVELTIKSDIGRMHMLGYNIDLDNPTLNNYLNKNKETSIYNLLLYVEIIKKDYGINLTNEEIESITSKPGNIGRPDLAVLLVQKGICKTIDEAFDKYLTPAYQKASKLKKGIDYKEGIDLIKGAGGVPVLAHPSSLLLDSFALERKVKEMKEAGLEGIEVIHTNENDNDRSFYGYLAGKYKLLETGGTDYHGDSKPDVKLGTGRWHNVSIKPRHLSLVRNVPPRYK